MIRWLKRARGALGMGAAWGVIWACIGMLIGLASNLLPFLPWHYFFAVWDAPLPALAVPGFVGGILFAAVLGIAGARRTFDQISIRRVAVWGAVGGLLLSLVPDAMVAVGLAHLRQGLQVWKLTAVTGVPLVALSTASAVASLLVARMGQGGSPAGADDDASAAHLSEGDYRQPRMRDRAHERR